MTLDIPRLRADFEGAFNLLETSDGIQLFLWKWEPETATPRQTGILIFHGITAYSGPYTMIAKPLAELGFTVYGLDLRGHGLSDGNRGDCPSRERFVKDLCEGIEFVKAQHERVVLIGHSLGVLSSILAMNQCLENIGGSVLLSAGLSLRHNMAQGLSASQKLKILFSSLLTPGKQVVEYKREGMVGLDDPLFTFKYSLRFLRLVRFEDLEFPELLDFPVFAGIGDSDELFSVESCRALFDAIPSEKKEFYVAEGTRHAVFPKDAWSPLLSWFDGTFS